MVNHEVFDKVFAVANKFVSMDARVKNVAVTLLHTETASLLQLISQRLDTVHTLNHNITRFLLVFAISWFIFQNQNGSSDNEDDEMDGHDDVHAKSNMRNAVKMFCYLIALVLDSQEKSAKAGKEIEAVAASVMIKKPRGVRSFAFGLLFFPCPRLTITIFCRLLPRKEPRRQRKATTTKFKPPNSSGKRAKNR
jgi:hypothetical protein